MPQITFNPNGITVEVPANSPLLEAAKKAGISVETPCGGNGVCGKCLVKVEKGIVDGQIFDNNLVLICKAKALNEDVTIHVFLDTEKEQGKFSSDDMKLIDKNLLPIDIDTIVKKTFIKVEQPQMGDGLSDLDRLKKAMSSNIEIPLSVLKTLPDKLRQSDGEITVAHYSNNIVDIKAFDTTEYDYGIAVDIGTTTVAVQLVNLKNGEIVASKTDYNAQIECGLDVISRINYAAKPHRLEELQTKVLTTINHIIKELVALKDISHSDIFNISIAGNTTMVHMLLGIVPENIRLDPYTPAVYNVPLYKASDIGLKVNKNAPVYIAPSVGSYVGGDITSGILCTSLATNSDEVCLFIDIGTNGELILGNNEFLLGCACSAGPAFEGGGIESGMRASKGAIERVQVDKDTGVPTFSVIGNVPPVGICGSGIITLISSLFETGWIDAAGKLDRNRPCSMIEKDKNAKYNITNGIYITEADIDNLIRAKGAIFSACRVMLENINMSFDDLSKVYIAGGFGRYLDIEKSQKIGLIPNLSPDKFVFLGNSSLIGAYMTLLSKKHRDKQTEIAKKITYIDLSTEPGYMDEYTAALFLPHTDIRLFQKKAE